MRALAFCWILTVAAACAPGEKAAESGTGTVIDSVPVRGDSTAERMSEDSIAGVADSAVPEVSVTSTSAAVIGDSVVRRDTIIGRDSAFGPRYRIDSTGKLVPIRRP